MPGRSHVALWAYLFLLLGCLPFLGNTLNDPDTLWHIAAGDLIRELRTIPTRDPWSFTAGSHAWMNIAWLFDLGLSWLHSWQGLAGVAKLALVLMALHGALMAWAAWRYCGSMILGLFVAILTAWSIMPGMLARPQWATYLLSLIFLLMMRFSFTKGRIWLLPVLMCLWSNLHGGFFIGFLVIGAFALEQFFAREIAHLLRTIAIGLLCLLAVFINPLGTDIFEAVLRTMKSPLAPFLVEWQPFRISNPLAALYVILFLWVSAFHSKRIGFAERLLALTCFLLALSSTRMFQVAATLCVPYLAIGLKEHIETSRFAAGFARKEKEYSADLDTPIAGRITAGLCLLATALIVSPLLQKKVPPDIFALPAAQNPQEEVDFAVQNFPQMRFLNHYDFGGFIIYHTRGKLPVFIDGRADTAYPRTVVMDTLAFFNPRTQNGISPPAFDELLRKYGIGGIITHRNDMLDRLLPLLPGWERVYQGKAASVLVRTGSPISAP